MMTSDWAWFSGAVGMVLLIYAIALFGDEYLRDDRDDES